MADVEDPNANPKPKPKSSCGCCFLKILAVCLVLGAIVSGVVGYFVYTSVSWFATAVETTPATYAPLEVSAGEQQDVDRVIQKLQAGKTQKDPIDETISPAVFNGIIAQIMQGEKDKGKKSDLEAFRLSIEGDHFQVALTTKTQNPDKNNPGTAYLNIKSSFDLEIADGKIVDMTVHSLEAGGKEAPSWFKLFANKMLDGVRDGTNKGTDENLKKLSVIKLLKRDGDRLHVILDPAKFDQPDDAPAPKPDAPKEPGKEAF